MHNGEITSLNPKDINSDIITYVKVVRTIALAISHRGIIIVFCMRKKLVRIQREISALEYYTCVV